MNANDRLAADAAARHGPADAASRRDRFDALAGPLIQLAAIAVLWLGIGLLFRGRG